MEEAKMEIYIYIRREGSECLRQVMDREIREASNHEQKLEKRGGVGSEEDKCMGERGGLCLLLNRVVCVCVCEFVFVCMCMGVCYMCKCVNERERERERERDLAIKGIERYAILCFLCMFPNWG